MKKRFEVRKGTSTGFVPTPWFITEDGKVFCKTETEEHAKMMVDSLNRDHAEELRAGDGSQANEDRVEKRLAKFAAAAERLAIRKIRLEEELDKIKKAAKGTRFESNLKGTYVSDFMA